MRKIRLLVVEDSVVVRRLVARAMEPVPDVQVCGVARNGRLAVQRVAELNPDAVLLDLGLPDMSGLEVLRSLKQLRPSLPVVVFSASAGKGAVATVEALLAGAGACVLKPRAAQSLDAGVVEVVRELLLPPLRALCGDRGVARRTRRGEPLATSDRRRRATRKNRNIEAVVIASSTGGPAALHVVLGALPADLRVPILVAQHMPEGFTELLAERLNRTCPVAVREASDHTALSRADVWIARAGQHLEVHTVGGRHQLSLNNSPPENACRPSADVLFRSAAREFGDRVLAVVLTGMGADGLRGCEAIKAAGGHVIAQDQATSVVWGMPRCVVESSLADEVLPLSEVGDAIVRLTAAFGRSGRSVGVAS